MKKITLTQGQYALIDDDDFDLVMKYKWFAKWNIYTQSFVAVRNRKPRAMQRLIMNTPKGLQTDHINHNTLDNRKENLRICTYSQNQMNQKKHKKTSSQFKGVSQYKMTPKWRARIMINYKEKYLGIFTNKTQAAKAYDKAAKRYFGEFARPNFS